MLTLTASGSVRYYSDRASTLQEKVANIAGVSRSDVTISPKAVYSDASAVGSVIITATITIRAFTTAAEVQASLASTLGTARSASTALIIYWVLSAPTIEIVTESTDNEEGQATVFGAPIGVIVGCVCGAFVTNLLCCFISRRRRSSAKARAACGAAGSSRVAPHTAPLDTPNVAQPGAPPQPQQQIQMSAAVPILLPPIAIPQMGAAVPMVFEGTIVQGTPYTCSAPVMPPPYPAGYPHQPAEAPPQVLMGQVVG